MKSRGSDPPLSSIKSGRALLSIWAALDGDPQRLLTRLRAGVASNAEQALAADLLEGKIKPRRPRRGSDRLSRFLVASGTRFLDGVFMGRQIASTGAFPTQLSNAQLKAMRKAIPRKTVLSLAREMVGDRSRMMSEREAYYALKEFNDAVFSQIRNMKEDDPGDGFYVVIARDEFDHDTLVQMAHDSLARK
jgi:hypothetical protein